MYESFTDHARQVMQRANAEARDRYDAYITAEHILLGIIEEQEGVAATVLNRLGVDFDQLRAELEALLPSETHQTLPGKPKQHTQAKRIIESAMEWAHNLNHPCVGTEHLLLGLLRTRPGEIDRLFSQHGIDEDRCLPVILDILNAPDYEERNSQFAGVARQRSHSDTIVLVALLLILAVFLLITAFR